MGDTPHIRFDVLGGLSVIVGDRTGHCGRNQRSTILGSLLCRVGRSLSFDAIAFELDTSRTNVQKARRKLISDLEDLGAGASRVLETTADGYRLVAEYVTTDADELSRLTTEAERLLPADPRAAALRSGDALALWAEPFDGLLLTAEMSDYSVMLEQVRLRALTTRARALQALNDSAAAVSAWRELWTSNPHDESVCHGLVTALARTGARHEALDVLGDLRDSYRERGWDMSKALDDLELALLTDEVSFEPSSLPAGPVEESAPKRRITAADLFSGRSTGRRKELATVERLVATALTTEPKAIVLEGEAGTGKTWILEEFSAANFSDSTKMIWVDFFEESSGGTKRLLEAVRATVGPLADAGGISVDSIASSILEASRVEPIAVVVDDVQWAETESIDQIELLLRLAGRPTNRDCRLAVLVARRLSGGVGSVDERLDRALSHRCSSTILLGPMNDLDVHELFRSIGLTRPSPLALSILRECTGANPLGIQRALKHLAHNDGLWESAGMTHLDARQTFLASSLSAAEMAKSPILKLSPSEQTAALLVAILGDHAYDTLLLDAIDRLKLPSTSIDRLLELGLATRRGDRLQFNHPSTTSAVIEIASQADYEELHGVVAHCLAGWPGAPRMSLHWRAEHLLRSALSDPADVVPILLAAGRDALDASSWSDADRFLSRAFELGSQAAPGSIDSMQIAALLGHAAFRDHQTGRAAALFEEVAEFGRATRDMALWGEGVINRSRSTVHDLRNFDPESDRQGMLDWLQHSEATDDLLALRADAYLQLATVEWGHRNFEAARDFALEAARLAERGGDAVVEARATTTLGLALVDNFEFEAALDAFDRSARAGNVEANVFLDWGRSRAARVHTMLGRAELAAEMAETAAESAERVSNWAEAALARTNLAAALFASGELERAGLEAREATRLYVRSDYMWVGTVLLPMSWSIASALGNEEWIRQLDDLRPPSGTTMKICDALSALGRRDLGRCREVSRPLVGVCERPLTATLAPLSVGAALAALTNDAVLAEVCTAKLTDPRVAAVKLTPATGRPVADDLTMCADVLSKRVDAASGAGLRSSR